MKRTAPLALKIQNKIISTLQDSPPAMAVQILPTSQGAPVVCALKLMLPDGLSPTHIGYLTRSILDAQNAASHRSGQFQILLFNEYKKTIEAYQQLALNPLNGRILLCAVGSDALEALGDVAIAAQAWPEASLYFDLDGAPLGEAARA